MLAVLAVAGLLGLVGVVCPAIPLASVSVEDEDPAVGLAWLANCRAVLFGKSGNFVARVCFGILVSFLVDFKRFSLLCRIFLCEFTLVHLKQIAQ